MVAVDWERLERAVVERIRALSVIEGDSTHGTPELRDKIRKDLILPCAHLLAKFCAAVELDGGDDA